MLNSVAQEKYWTRRSDARLVKYVERRRCLWDPTHPHYTSTALRQQVYEAFVSKYGSHFSAESVKERWVNIRSTFGCCLRKLEASHLTTPDKPYEPSWHLWTACQFLMKVKKSSEPSTSTDLKDQVKTESDWDIDEEAQALLMKVDEEANVTADDDNETSNLNDSLNCNDVVQGIVSALRGVESGLFTQEHQEYGKIGRLITKKLSKMNSYEAAIVSHKIMEILLLYDENNPNNPNNVLDVDNET